MRRSRTGRSGKKSSGHWWNVKTADGYFREIYLRAFEIVVKKADPWSIMTSYPRVNGTHIDAQPKFMQDILRGEWGYKGLIMTDWGAASAAAESIKYGYVCN